MTRREFSTTIAGLTLLQGASGQSIESRPGNVMMHDITASISTSTMIPVLTRGYDNLRSCANTQETILTPAALKQNPLRKLFTIAIPGDTRGMESQPLFVPGLLMPDGATHDVMISTTMGNQIYCHDANDGTPLWMLRVGRPLNNTKALDWYAIGDHWGILSTGVIDSNTLYCVAAVAPDGTVGTQVFRLYAVDLSRGAAVRVLQLTQPNAVMQRKQRGSLSFATANGKKTIFIPWSTMQEFQSGAHGYIMAVDVDTFRVTAELNITPEGSEGGIWQSGQGMLIDQAGFIYLLSSNGSYDGVNNFSECFLKIQYTGTSLKIVDHWSPFEDRNRPSAFTDQDLGSGAPAIIPELNIIFGAGKDGVVYTRQLNNFSTAITPPYFFDFYPGNGIDPANITNLNKDWFQRTHNVHSTNPVWKSSQGWRTYCWGENSPLRVWSVDAQGLHYLATGNEYASAMAPVPPGGMPGGFLCVSANGQQNGIVWASVPDGDANKTVTTGRLYAYDALNYQNGIMPPLWKSDQFSFNKFMAPVVNGGRVYLPTFDAQILVYGL